MGPLTLAVLAALGPAVLLVAALLGDAPGDRRLRWAVPVALLVLLVAAWARGRARRPAGLAGAGGVAGRRVPVRHRGRGGRRRARRWLIFGYVFVLTVHHYDLTARLEKRQAAPPLHASTLGWEGRSVLLALAAIAGMRRYGHGYTRCVPSRGFRGERRPGLGRPAGPRARASARPLGAGGADAALTEGTAG